MNSSIDRDERTLTVENAGYRWAFHFLSFGMLILVCYRSISRNDPAWDLLSLVVLGGVVASGYQWRNQVLTKRWLLNGLVTMLAAALAAALIVWLR